MEEFYRCNKCGEYKNKDSFYPHKGITGISHTCKSCEALRNREYKKLHSEENKKYCKQWNIEHKEHVKIYNKAYKESHKVSCRLAYKKWRKTPEGKAKAARDGSTRRSRVQEVYNTLTAEEWKDILVLQDNKCLACNCEMNNIWLDKQQATREHIIPVRYGGSLMYGNVVALCRSCNSKSTTNRNLYELPDYITAYNSIT